MDVLANLTSVSDRRAALIALLTTANSATAALMRLTAGHGWREPVLVRKGRAHCSTAPEEAIRALAVQQGERLVCRVVELVCGDRVLSKATNWYVASRLPQVLNERLETSDVPFGHVLAELKPQRGLLHLQCLPADDSMAGLSPDIALFQLNAVLTVETGDGNPRRRPVAWLDETYFSVLL